MSTPALWQAVYARYLADTAAGAGLNQNVSPKALLRGMYLEQAPDNAEYPYVVFTVQDDAQEDSLGKARSVVYPVFSIYMNKDNNLASMATIIARLAYVYHKWIPTLSGYEFETMQRRGGRMIPTDDDSWHFADEYVVGITTTPP